LNFSPKTLASLASARRRSQATKRHLPYGITRRPTSQARYRTSPTRSQQQLL